MRSGRWFHVAMSLLLGGLFLPPAHSQAGTPSITIQIVGVTSAVTIPLGANSCTSAERTAGYTACYPLQGTTGTGTNRAGVIVQNAPNAVAKLLVADTNGSGGKLDLFTLSGVMFNPQASAGSSRTVKVIYSITLDVGPNPVGTYSYAMRSGGYFQAGDGSTVNNYIKLSGTGKFAGSGSTAKVLSPDLTLTVGGPATTATSFSLKQVPTYPFSSCNNGAGSCTPILTQTLTFVVNGPDKLVLTNSLDGAGGSCNLTVPGPEGPPAGTFAQPCKGKNNVEKNTTTFFGKQDNADSAAASAAGAVPAVACPASPGQECPAPPPDCDDPAGCGTIRIDKTITCSVTCGSTTFEFTIAGPSPSEEFITYSITMNGGSPPDEPPYTYTETQSLNVPVSPGTYTVSEPSEALPPGWEFESLTCSNGSLGTVSVDFETSVACSIANRTESD